LCDATTKELVAKMMPLYLAASEITRRHNITNFAHNAIPDDLVLRTTLMNILSEDTIPTLREYLTQFTEYATLLKNHLCIDFQNSNLSLSQKYLMNYSNNIFDSASKIITILTNMEGEKNYYLLTELIENELNYVEREAKYKMYNAQILRKYDDPEKGLLIKCNPVQIGSVINNIALNACHAMQDSTKKVLSVETRYKQNNGIDMAYIRIHNTGEIISPENLTHIFEPLFTTKCKGEGTGLGLTNSKNIIESHGGIIELASSKKEGTYFTIWLPLARNYPLHMHETAT
jgi:signal transduction histidine kinase